jgi:branched-chain amino acid transport system permease protein
MRTALFGVGVLGIALVLTLVLSEFQISLLTEMLIAGLFALSLNLVLGYGGMVHFGHAAFYGIGGYTVAIATTRLGVSPFVAFLCAPFVSALAGLVIGWFCVRRTQLYFSILTLAFAQLVYLLVFQAREVTNGDDGIQGLPLPEAITGIVPTFIFTVLVVLACYLLIRHFVQTPFVLLLKAVRDDHDRARFIGVDVRAHQLMVFVIGAFFAGVAGALMAWHNRFVTVDMLFWTTSAEPLLASLLGGMGTLAGPLLGGALLTLLEVVTLRITPLWSLLLGVITIALVLLAPKGIMGWLKRS